MFNGGHILPVDATNNIGFVFESTLTLKSYIDMIASRTKLPQIHHLCQFLDDAGLSLMYKATIHS